MTLTTKVTLETLGIAKIEPGIVLVRSRFDKREERRDACMELLTSLYASQSKTEASSCVITLQEFSPLESIKDFIVNLADRLNEILGSNQQESPFVYIRDLGPIFGEIMFPMPAFRRLNKIIKDHGVVAIMETDFTPGILHAPLCSYRIDISNRVSNGDPAVHITYYKDPYVQPEPKPDNVWTSYLQETKAWITPKLEKFVLIEGIPGQPSLLPANWVDIVGDFDNIIKNPDKLIDYLDLEDGRSTYRLKFNLKVTLEEANRIGSLYLLSGWKETSIEMESDDQGQREYYLVLSAHPST